MASSKVSKAIELKYVGNSGFQKVGIQALLLEEVIVSGTQLLDKNILTIILKREEAKKSNVLY
jgi:hypothetical protein